MDEAIFERTITVVNAFDHNVLNSNEIQLFYFRKATETRHRVIAIAEFARPYWFEVTFENFELLLVAPSVHLEVKQESEVSTHESANPEDVK